jgi:hypothetical protein
MNKYKFIFGIIQALDYICCPLYNMELKADFSDAVKTPPSSEAIKSQHTWAR